MHMGNAVQKGGSRREKVPARSILAVLGGTAARRGQGQSVETSVFDETAVFPKIELQQESKAPTQDMLVAVAEWISFDLPMSKVEPARRDASIRRI
jgi:hypothetical protein